MINLNNQNKNKFTLKAVKKISSNTDEFNKQFLYELDPKDFLGGNFYKKMRNYFEKINFNINIDLNSFLAIVNKEGQLPLLNAIFSSHENIYHLPCCFKSKLPKKIHHNFLVDTKKYGKVVNEALSFVYTESFSRKLMGLPNNYLNPAKFVQFVKEEFSKFNNVEIKVLDKKDLINKKMNLILGVGANAKKEDEPMLLVVSSKIRTGKKLALVGKGVCFDTGGLNLKPGSYLMGMNYDMSGAAVVVGTMMAIANNNINANVSIVCPLVVNDISNEGMKVSDVITSYSKQTVEITNTDAEGRLILADAITYAEKNLKADTIVSIATLTGAVEYCFSDVYTPVWCTNRKQFNLFQQAANKAGELIWEMPMHFEYENRMKSSKIADMLNSEKTRGAGSSTAACFLSFFRKKANYNHMDIASTNEYKSLPLPIMVKTLYYFTKEFR